MRFSDKQIEEMVENYLAEAIYEYIEEVEELFLLSASLKYKDYMTFTEDVLKRFFNGSDFKKLINDDPSYVMDRYPEYWVSHIVREIDKVVDFKTLKLKEEEKIRTKYIEDLFEVELSVESAKLLIKHYSNIKFEQVKYVKHKKEFKDFIGLSSSLNNSIKAFKDMFISDSRYGDSNYLANSQLEKDIVYNTVDLNNVNENDLKYFQREYEHMAF